MGAMLLIVWYFVVANTPNESKLISYREKIYLENEIEFNNSKNEVR